MLKNKIFLLVIILSLGHGLKVTAQNNIDSTAHFRALTFGIGVGFDSRLNASVLNQEFNLMFLDALLEVSGNYAFQISQPDYIQDDLKFEEYGVAERDYDKRSMQYEFEISCHFWRKLKQDANLSRSSGSGNFTSTIFIPGSRAMLIGTHIGFGHLISKVATSEQSFNLIDQNGKIYNAPWADGTSNGYRYRTFSNFTSNYVYAGVHYKNSVIKDNKKMKFFGWGRNLKYYIDFMLPLGIETNTMYSNLNDLQFTPIPFEGKTWQRPGYRAGVKSLGGPAILSMGFEVEVGNMPSLQSSNSYLLANLSLIYKPKKYPMKLELL